MIKISASLSSAIHTLLFQFRHRSLTYVPENKIIFHDGGKSQQIKGEVNKVFTGRAEVVKLSTTLFESHDFQ